MAADFYNLYVDPNKHYKTKRPGQSSTALSHSLGWIDIPGDEELPFSYVITEPKPFGESEPSETAASKSEDELRLEEEHIQSIIDMELPTDWLNAYEDDASLEGITADTIPDGFIKCLNNKGYVDIEYISAITGEDCKTVIEKLKGSIYQNPKTFGECFYKGWETAEEYLSGNIREKLNAAIAANEMYHGYFSDNVEALKRVMPPALSAGDIYATLGSPWIPAEIYEEFLAYITNYKRTRWSGSSHFNLVHDEETATWEFSYRTAAVYSPFEFEQKYGTRRRTAIEIFIRTLNMQSVAVYDTIDSDFTKSGKKSVLNNRETVDALEKQKLLISEFKEWLWSDERRAGKLKDIYEAKYGCIRQRHFDGIFLELPGMDESVRLYPYQKNAIARIIFSPNTLLAHDVGSGKTYIMIAAGMELKRMNISPKNMYVVPNNIAGQWRSMFYAMYPNAFIKVIEPKDFKPDKREAVLRDIKDNEYDAVIIAYSCFSQIPLSAEYELQKLNEERARLMELAKKEDKRTKKLLDRIDKLREQAYDKMAERKADEGITFDKLGITRLFVDEAHNFKNIPIDSKIENVLGISKTGSVKCRDMMSKVHIVQKQNGGNGVVMATGTPITNSITDAFAIQMYLQSGELAILELQNFDSWVGMFAEQTTNFEIDVDTSNYRMATRFARFHNIPELTNMLASIADFHSMDRSQGVPDHDGYIDVIVHKTAAFNDFLKNISQRADAVRSGMVKRTEDNMLLITTDGRKGALDIRLVDPNAKFSVYSKVFACAEKVAQIYKATAGKSSTQLVFCDTSTPGKGFNIYDELKGLLVRLNVKSEEIAYIHDATTDAKREKLFERVRKGEIRVLIGSTFKLGLGVNVQNKLIALHHLDVPWRPADMVQREGRILRQGNENPSVEIYRYITEGSFDAYSWQLLETKQRFISDLLSGTSDTRVGADVDNTVLNYAEVKALAIGSPLIKERVEVANELSKYIILQQKAIAQRQIYEQEINDLPVMLDKIKALIPLALEDAEAYEAGKREYGVEERRVIRTSIFEAAHQEEPTREETIVAQYQGFDVVVPAHVSKVNPVVLLRRAGEYRVELTSNDVGSLLRIDRCLDDLADRHERLTKRSTEIEDRMTFMKTELGRENGYSEQIEKCRVRLAKLDAKLGVGKD